MNILVTGAAGYIGSILIPSLLQGHKVTALDRFFSDTLTDSTILSKLIRC